MQCDYIEGPPTPPRIAKNAHVLALRPIHENWDRVVIFPLDVNIPEPIMRG